METRCASRPPHALRFPTLLLSPHARWPQIKNLGELLDLSEHDSDKLADLNAYAKQESVNVGAVIAGLTRCGQLEKDTAKRLLRMGMHLKSDTQALPEVGTGASVEEARRDARLQCAGR